MYSVGQVAKFLGVSRDTLKFYEDKGLVNPKKNAENVGVSVKTSFYMRNKVLDCIKSFMGVGDVDGIVEMEILF